MKDAGMKTGTQNRPYTADALCVRATLNVAGKEPRVLEFNWNSREDVRYFAAQSDDCIRAGGKTVLEAIQ